MQLRTDDRSRVVRHGPSLPTTESLRSCLPTTYASRRRIPFVSLVRATARGCALSLLRVTALCRYPTDHDLRLPGTFLSITGNGRCEFPAYRHTDEYLTRHCLVPVSFRITNLADGWTSPEAGVLGTVSRMSNRSVFPLRCSQLPSSPKEGAVCCHIRCAILASASQLVDSLMSRVSS